MRIGILSQWYPPEPGPASLPGELAAELARRGHDVQVVTGFPNYPEGRVYPHYRMKRRVDEIQPGISVRRIALFPSHSASAFGRVLNYASFGASVAASALDVLSTCDVVWVSNSPPTVGWAMRRLRQLGVPIVLHVLDLWPDNLVASGMAGRGIRGKAVIKAADGLTRATYDCADRVVAISPGVVDLLASRGVPEDRLLFCPLWANESVFRPLSGDAVRHRVGVPDSKVVVLYAGAIGATQDLRTLISALEMVPAPSADEVECWIIGDGVGSELLAARVGNMPSTAPTVRLLGRRPMMEMPAWTAAADICYVGLHPDEHARHTLPSKVQTSTAMAKPLLASVPGDVHKLVKNLGLGLSSGAAGPTELSELIQRAIALGRPGLATMGQHSRAAYEEHFSLEAGVDRLESLLTTLTGAACHNSVRSDGVRIDDARKSEISAIVDVHMKSFRGFFLTFLGPRFLNLFYDDLRTQPGATLLVARKCGQVVGFVGGVIDEDAYFTGLRQRKARAFIAASLGAAARNPRVVPRLWRARRRGSLTDEVETPATLLSIAVSPDAQGGGVGALLVDAFSGWLTGEGAIAYKLATDARRNDATLRFYRARGLEEVRLFTTPEGREMVEFKSPVRRAST